MLKKIAIISVVAAAAFVAAPAMAQTPDGETPAEENVCDGQVGQAFGLCNAYCEAMDCDSLDPQASETACAKVGGRFESVTGMRPPCEMFCPCFDAADIQQEGTIFQCGKNFPGFDNLAGVLFDNGEQACSGELCADSTSSPSCGFTPAGVLESDISPEQDSDCRAIIIAQCNSPNIIQLAVPESQSLIPFIDQ